MLKRYWWRFNGYGYFWGMVAGIGASLVLPWALPSVSALNSFPIILVIGIVGCVAGTLLTPPEDDEVLKSFYKRVRPWGFWGPIQAKVQAEDPTFRPNPDFQRDMFNIVVGIVWQTSLVAFPVYIVIRKWESAAVALGLVLATAVVLKFTWYDNLDAHEAEDLPAPLALH